MGPRNQPNTRLAVEHALYRTGKLIRERSTLDLKDQSTTPPSSPVPLHKATQTVALQWAQRAELQTEERARTRSTTDDTDPGSAGGSSAAAVGIAVVGDDTAVAHIAAAFQ